LIRGGRTPMVAPLRAMAISPETIDYTFRNWAQTQSCTPDRFYRPRNTEEVVEVVREAAQSDVRLKVVGAGLSYTDAALSPPRGWLISLEHMNRVLEVDKVNGRVRVQAGIRLGDLNELLAQHRLALEVLPAVSEPSLAGAIATASHGTGRDFGVLSTCVTSLQLVTADAEVHEVDPDDADLFAAAAAGLGALGVVTEVTLAVVPAFLLEESRFTEPLDVALAALPRRLEDHAHVRLVWFPYVPKVEVVCQDRTSTPPNRPLGIVRWLDDRLTAFHARRLVAWLTHVFPEHVPRLNRFARWLARGRRTRVGRSDHLLAYASPPRHEAMEYAIPAERAAEALRALRALVEGERIPVNGEVELRWARADAIWLSPAQGRDVCYVRAAANGQFVTEEYFPAFHRLMRGFEARPHLGCVHLFEPLELLDVMPRARAFDALRRRLDPTGLFANDFVTRLFGP
jgi:FAD/FMN-containing dehydrogenase